MKHAETNLEWYAVRLVLRRLDADDYVDLAPDELVYEETIRLVQATSHDNCLDVAEKLVQAEAKEYGYFIYTGYSEGFRLFDPPEHGAEVYSTLRSSKLDTEAYVKRYVRTGKEMGFANEFESEDEQSS